ncbi:MAG TPA: PQQ-binding-like beta-propeller repeat protein [Polyangia bacterium]
MRLWLFAFSTALLLSDWAFASECQVWSQSRCDAQNQAAIELRTLPGPPPHAWSFDGSGRVWGYEPGLTVWSSPALDVAGDHPIVVAGNYDHTLYCLDAATGESLWKFTTGGPIYAAPVFYRDGARQMLFAASNDRIVYALDPVQGRQIWVHAVEDFRPSLGGARLAAPCVGGVGDRDDAVFVPYWIWDRSLGNSMQRGGVVALSVEDGRPLWRVDLGDSELTAAIFVRLQGRGTLFLGSSSGNLYALAASNGQVLWKRAELDCVRSPPALVATGQGPMLVTGSKFGTVRGLDAKSGVERWQFRTGDRITGSPAVLGGTHPSVFVGSYDRRLYAIGATDGSQIWQDLGRGGFYSSPAVIAEGSEPMVLATAWDHMLHANDLVRGTPIFTAFTGRPLWNVGGMDDSNWSSPAAARIRGRWMAFVGSYDGVLRALPLEAADRSAPELRSNLWFWLSFPIVLLPFAGLAVLLTQRERRRKLGFPTIPAR